MASALRSFKRRKDVGSEPSLIASQPRSLNDLPEEILLKILSYFGPEYVYVIIAEVCQRWNDLANDVTLWRTLSYHCDHYSDISCIAEISYTSLLGFRTNWLTNFVPSSVLNVQNLKKISEIGPFSILIELRQFSRVLHCVTPSCSYR